MLAALMLAAAAQLPVKTDTTVTLAASAATVPVHAGDTLAGIAAAHCGTPRAWSSIYAASRTAGLLGPDPNVIYPGQSAEIACTGGVSASPPAAAPAQAPAAGGRTWGKSYAYPNYCGDGDGDGWDVDCQSRSSSPAPAAAAQAPASRPVTVARQAPAATHSGGSGFQACVIARESGGNPQVMNASGHYGLYQFDAQTWASGGGNPAAFGHASVAEQNAVFASVYAARGTQPWAPYDGC